MAKGKFIVFAGMNGCGKGTQMDLFVPWLFASSKSNLVFWTREPNELDKHGKNARQQLKEDKTPYEKGREALSHFCENRYTHNNLFKPLIESGVHVVSDRYFDSTFVYQHLQGVSYEEIAEANREFARPDLMFILNISAEESMRRIAEDEKRKDKSRKFETDLDFARKVSEEYGKLPENLARYLHYGGAVGINGERSPEAIQSDIRKIFLSL